MKNGDNLFRVIVDESDPSKDFTVRADSCEVTPANTLVFVTYSGPQSGRMIVKARSAGTWVDVEYKGEHRG